MNGVRVLTAKKSASGDRVQRSFHVDSSLSKHIHTQANFTQISICDRRSVLLVVTGWLHIHFLVTGACQNISPHCITLSMCRGLCNRRSVRHIFWRQVHHLVSICPYEYNLDLPGIMNLLHVFHLPRLVAWKPRTIASSKQTNGQTLRNSMLQ